METSDAPTVIEPPQIFVPFNPVTEREHISYDRLRWVLHGKTGAKKIGEGGERDVYLLRQNQMVAKVDHYPSLSAEVEDRIDFQDCCQQYFPHEAVQREFYAKHRDGQRAVAFQKFLHQMKNPERVVVCGGYAERKHMVSPALYDKVSRAALLRSEPYKREDFLLLHGNERMERLFQMTETDPAFRDKLGEFLSAAIWFSTDTGHGLDIMGGKPERNENIILYPDDEGWHYLFCDQRVPVSARLLPRGKFLLEKFHKGNVLHHDEWIHLINFVDYVRIVNCLADDLCFDEEERLHLDLPQNIDFSRLQAESRPIAA